MNWIVLKSDGKVTILRKFASQGQTQLMQWKMQRELLFFFFSPMSLKVGTRVCLITILNPLVTSCWSLVVDTLPRRPSTSEGNLPRSLTMKSGCKWHLLHTWAWHCACLCCLRRWTEGMGHGATGKAGLPVSDWETFSPAGSAPIPSLIDLWYEK